MSTQLNLPIWSANSKSVDRVGAARAKAYKASSDIVKSIPDTANDEELLHTTMNKMLASGTIKSLEEFYDITGAGNPSPTKADNEASLNSSGYTVVDGSNFFKLYEVPDSSNDYDNYGSNSLSNNVEAIRMLYNAGMSISSIRSTLQSMKEGDVLTLGCKKVLKRFPKYSYVELLSKYSDFRGYPEYLTIFESSTYAVCDEIGGNDSTFILYIKQDLNDSSVLYCEDISFPVKGSLTININNKDYFYNIDACDSFSLIAQLNKVESPMSFYYDNGLILKSKHPFYFPNSEEKNTIKELRIEEALLKARESFYSGYSGVSFKEGLSSPFNIVIKKAGYSKSNIRKIYTALKNNGIEDSICNSYLLGKSLYSKSKDCLENLRKVVQEHPTNYSLIKAYEDSYFKSSNVRILGTTIKTIERLLKLSDSSLEYLLRYRIDITAIDPYVSDKEAKEAIINKANSSFGNSYYKSNNKDSWKPIAAHSRTTYFYIKTLGNYLNQTNNYSNWIEKTNDFLGIEPSMQEEVTNYGESLGMSLSSSVNWEASSGFAVGLDSFASISATLDASFKNEFEEDLLIAQAYLSSASSALQGVCSKLTNTFKIINSSLNVTANGGSLLQCSLSVDLGLVIPAYIPSINLSISGLVSGIDSGFQAVVGIEDTLLCPIQNIIDKYVNTDNFALPCKISYNVPKIDGIEFYLSGYVSELVTLKMMCNILKKDSNRIKFNASMMPGSLELLVTKSKDCEES